MNRILVVGFAVALFGGMAWVHSAQDGKTAKTGDDSKAFVIDASGKAEIVKRQEPLAARLAKRIDFKGFDDPKMTLQDALEYLAKHHDVLSEVQEAPFRTAGYADKSVLSEPIATTPIPEMKHVTLDTVIRKILGRIATPPGKEAAYMLQGDILVITTGDFLISQIWGNYPGPYFPLVHPSFDDRRLEDALKELAEVSGHNIVVDKRLGAKAQVPVTIKMTNAPLDTVVRFLTDMSELDAVLVDNAIYVTTKENAETWNKRLLRERKDPIGDDSPPRPPRIGTTPPVPTPPGSTPPGA